MVVPQPGQPASPCQAVEGIVLVIRRLANHRIHNAGEIAGLIVNIAQILQGEARLAGQALQAPTLADAAHCLGPGVIAIVPAQQRICRQAGCAQLLQIQPPGSLVLRLLDLVIACRGAVPLLQHSLRQEAIFHQFTMLAVGPAGIPLLPHWSLALYSQLVTNVSLPVMALLSCVTPAGEDNTIASSLSSIILLQ